MQENVFRPFADAFYFVARLNGRDQHHDRVPAFC
jgi:hypothetical protein